jgi:hypothetical protein
MSWVWIAGLAWVVLGVAAALLIAHSIRVADHKAANRFEDEPNVVIDRPPLRLAPKTQPRDGEAAEPERPAQPPTVPGASTIPGLPSARPPVGRPPVPRSTRRHPRKSGLG